MILRILGFLFVFHTLLFADTSTSIEERVQIKSTEVVKAKSVAVKEEIKVDFNNQSVLFMLVVTSLLGSFFLKDELADSI